MVIRVEVVTREVELWSEPMVPIVSAPDDDDDVVDSNDSEEVRSGESWTLEVRFDCGFDFNEDFDKTLGRGELDRA